MRIEKRIHKGWEEWENLPEDFKKEMMEKFGTTGYFGKYQYIYTKGFLWWKKRISLIQLTNYYHDGIDLWEIFCFNSIIGTERFQTKEQAEKRIKELFR